MWKNILCSLVLILLIFSILELLCRSLLDLKEPIREADLEYTVDPDILWHFVPNQHLKQPHRGIEYVINSHGLRCPDFPLKKPEGERRILTIGDSVTFGYNVPEGKAYPNLLQKYLYERFPDVPVRMINGGVNAYSTREELMFLRRNGIMYEPDVVIVGFVLNDISQISRQHYLEEFGEQLTKNPLRNKLKDARELLEMSHFVGFVSRFTKTIGARLKGRRGKGTHNEQRALHYRDLIYIEKVEIEEGWKVGMEELGEMAALLREHGVEMVLVSFPARLQLEEVPTPDKPQKRLKEFCESHGVVFLDLLPTFLENKGIGLYLDHIHLTSEGYAHAAREIGDCLIENGFFDGEH